MKNLSVIVNTYIFSAFFVLVLSLPTIYFGFIEEDNLCQEGTRAGMVLSDWLKVAGLTALVYTFFIPTIVMIAQILDVDAVIYAIPIVMIMDIFFWIVWVVLGIVILATNENRRCIEEGTTIGVMTVLQLVLGFNRFAYLYIGAKMMEYTE